MSDLDLTTRNASLAELTWVHHAQHVAKLDIVTPARHLSAVGGDLRVLGWGRPAVPRNRADGRRVELAAIRI